MKIILFTTLALLLTAWTLMHLKDQEANLHRRTWTYDNSHLVKVTQDHIHLWMNNAWYRYICSHMFTTTQHAILYGRPMNMTQVTCAASFANLDYQYSGIVLNHSDPLTIGLSFWAVFKCIDHHQQRAKSGNWCHKNDCYATQSRPGHDLGGKGRTVCFVQYNLLHIYSRQCAFW